MDENTKNILLARKAFKIAELIIKSYQCLIINDDIIGYAQCRFKIETIRVTNINQLAMEAK